MGEDAQEDEPIYRGLVQPYSHGLVAVTWEYGQRNSDINMSVSLNSPSVRYIFCDSSELNNMCSGMYRKMLFLIIEMIGSLTQIIELYYITIFVCIYAKKRRNWNESWDYWTTLVQQAKSWYCHMALILCSCDHIDLVKYFNSTWTISCTRENLYVMIRKNNGNMQVP
jgi:hypothetical protein